MNPGNFIQYNYSMVESYAADVAFTVWKFPRGENNLKCLNV